MPNPTRIHLKRVFLTNLILLVGLNLLVKPFYLLVVESEIQNRVGPEVFGSYFALINFSFILNILLDLGTTNRNTRKISHTGKINLRQLTGMISLRTMLAFSYTAICLITGLILDYSTHQLFILGILAFNQVLVSGILFLRSYLTGMHLFRHDSLISILDRALLLIMMSCLLWFYPGDESSFNIEWLVWGQTFSYALTFILALALVLKKSRQQEQEEVQKEPVKLILSESFPFALLILISMIGYRIDSVMLERISGSHESGIYAMGYRFFEAVNMISYLFAVILLPMFARMLSNKENIAPLLHLSFKILFTGVFTLALLSWFNAGPVLSLFYDQHITQATDAFAWLMISSLFFSMQYVTGTLITASGKMGPMILVALGGMVFNIALNFYYIPTLGSKGAAISSCMTQALIFTGQIILIRNQFRVGNLSSLFMRTSLFSITCIGCGYLIYSDQFLSVENPFLWLILLLATLILSVIIRMLDVNGFMQLLKTMLTKNNNAGL